MQKILIVDDEPLARFGIKFLLNNNGLDISIQEASNGEEAKSMLLNERFDIVLTDIKMPAMDGLELTKWIDTNADATEVIILSNYNEIEFVKEAMRQGASDFILKYEVEKDDFKKIIEKSILKSSKNINKTENALPKYDDYLGELIVKNIIVSNNQELYERSRMQFDFNLELMGKSLICIVNLRNYDSLLKEKYAGDRHTLDFALENLIREKLKINKMHFYIEEDFKRILLLELQDENELKNELTGLQHALKKYLDITAHIGVSSFFSNMSVAHEAYKKTDRALERSFFEEKDCIIYAGDCPPGDFPDESYREHVLNELYKIILENKEGELGTFVRQIVKEVSERKSSADMSKELFLRMADVIKNVCSNCGVFHENATDFANYCRLIKESRSLAEIKMYLEGIVQIVHSMNFLMQSGRFDSITNKTIEQVNRRFCSNDLSLNALAGELNVNKTYLCRLFKEKTGMNFIEYITVLRLEKAKKLLEHKDKLIKEICFESGYENYNHFCKVFKRYTGKAPSEYRHKSQDNA